MAAKEMVKRGLTVPGAPVKISVFDEMFADFKNDRRPTLAALRQLEDSMEPGKLEKSFETLAILRTRAQVTEGKPLRALETLRAALAQEPSSLALQLELNPTLLRCFEYLTEAMNSDPESDAIEPLFNALRDASSVNPGAQSSYARILVGRRRFAEALKIVLPLAELYPALPGLRETALAISEVYPVPALREYLSTPVPRLGRPTFRSHPDPAAASVLKQKFELLRGALKEPSADPVLRQVEAITGTDDEAPLDVALKEFHYLRAILLERKERYFEAFALFRALVEADPCNFQYRRSMEIEADLLVQDLVKRKASIDLGGALDAMKYFTTISHEHYRDASLRDVELGKAESAKKRMVTLHNLNPVDADYLQAALEVARFLKDEVWLDELELKAKK